MTISVAEQDGAGEHSPRRMWVVWTLYFVQFAGVGAYLAYLNVYYRSLGLSGTQIGLMNMAGSVAAVGGAVWWGYLSDRLGKPRWILAGCALALAGLVQAVPLFGDRFPLLFGMSMMTGLMGSALVPLLDGATLSLLGARSNSYGLYRMGGTLGYIVAGVLGGFLYDAMGLRLIFVVYGGLMATFALLALRLPAVVVRREEAVRGALARMMRQRAWVFLAISVLLVWIANYTAILYVGIALLEMGASKSLIGVATTAVAIIEVPLMALSGRLIDRFGVKPLMLIGMGVIALRLVLLGWMTVPEWALAINLLNGPGYVFFANSAIAYAKQLAPPSLSATSQGLLNSISNLSAVISALAAGVLFDQVGARGMFLSAGACAALALVIFALGAWGKEATVEEV